MTTRTIPGKNNTCIDHVKQLRKNTTTDSMLRSKLRRQYEKRCDYLSIIVPGTDYELLKHRLQDFGEIIEVQSGLEYDEYVKQYVLDPMGIDNLNLVKP